MFQKCYGSGDRQPNRGLQLVSIGQGPCISGVPLRGQETRFETHLRVGHLSLGGNWTPIFEFRFSLVRRWTSLSDENGKSRVCQCCSRRTAEKGASDGEEAAGSAGKRRQMGGGDSTKVEAPKREKTGLRSALHNGSDWSTERKMHETIQRKVRYLLWDRAQIEEGGNGGAVQQRGKGRMEIWC